jgi:hypothetical protein
MGDGRGKQIDELHVSDRKDCTDKTATHKTYAKEELDQLLSFGIVICTASILDGLCVQVAVKISNQQVRVTTKSRDENIHFVEKKRSHFQHTDQPSRASGPVQSTGRHAAGHRRA